MKRALVAATVAAGLTVGWFGALASHPTRSTTRVVEEPQSQYLTNPNGYHALRDPGSVVYFTQYQP